MPDTLDACEFIRTCDGKKICCNDCAVKTECITRCGKSYPHNLCHLIQLDEALANAKKMGEEMVQLQAELAMSRRANKFLIGDIIALLGKRGCILCPHFFPPEKEYRCSFSNTSGCISSIGRHYLAKAAAEGKGGK